MTMAGAYGRRAANVRPTWVTSRLMLGVSGDEDEAAVRRDGTILERWFDTVDDRDPVWILGGVGDPEWLAGLPGMLYLLAGPGDPMWTGELAPVLDERPLHTGGVDAHPGELIEARRAEIVADWRARATTVIDEHPHCSLAAVYTGYGAHVDDKRGIVHPRLRPAMPVRPKLLVTAEDRAPVGTAPDARCITALDAMIDNHDLRPVRLENL